MSAVPRTVTDRTWRTPARPLSALRLAALACGATPRRLPAADAVHASTTPQVSAFQTPLAYFLHAFGPATTPVLYLDWALTALCLFVCLVIAAMLLFALFRRRRKAHPRALFPEGGVRLVSLGTAISTVALIGVTTGMLWVLADVSTPPRTPTLAVTVTAYDWWWKVDYDDGAGRFSTANELHIPVGQPVLVLLRSADVIHAFWVPALSGKTQTIPGSVNRQWLQTDRPGIYRGQCTQFCGAQHAHMAFEVVAQSPNDYAKWVGAQRRPASPPAAADSMRGQHLLEQRCAGCHAVQGTDAQGVQAPDLTHLGSRRLIGAGALVNTPENVMSWVQRVQEIKPGALMPDMKLSASEAHDLAAYLATLR